MDKYPLHTFSYGCELEWGDVDRRLVIPENLGKWEFSETDIVNLHNPAFGIACDPLGLEPHWGGEINTQPSHTIDEQVKICSDIKDFFIKNNNTPTASMVSHTHVHIHVPNLIEDIDSLKKLTNYIFDNQKDMIEYCGKFVDMPDITKAKAKMYLKQDGGRMIPEYIVKNINERATDFDSFIKMHAAGKDGVSMGRPFRYGINMYSLKHTKTVEFRMFRSTTDINQMKDVLEICSLFLYNALNDGISFKEIIALKDWNLPEFYFDKPLWDKWIETKYPKERGKKQREFKDI